LAGAVRAVAIIPSPRPPFVVLGHSSRHESAEGSTLTFIVQPTREVALRLQTDLHDLVALAYSPSGQLYAADFAANDVVAGGIYRIDDARADGRQTCRSVKIASITHPLAMAFTPDGHLYVTAFGEGENAKQGSLLKITGDF
ncbi:unnamed protein product, partial [marine sediment metagenome]